MGKAIKAVFWFGPLMFGIGFIAPLTAQTLVAFNLSMPFNLTALQVGLGTGLALGLLAQVRGRWI
ncbi:MAG: hypothetical protein AAGF20_08845 [Pseudomonadota bacterium]